VNNAPIDSAAMISLNENDELDFEQFSKINFTINYHGSENHVHDLRFNLHTKDGYPLNDYLKVVIDGQNSSVINAHIEVVKEPSEMTDETVVIIETYNVKQSSKILDMQSFTLSGHPQVVAIPDEDYDIESEVNGVHLKGVKEGLDLEEYNAMIIPENVQYIDDYAFVNQGGEFVYIPTIPSNIQRLIINGNCAVGFRAFLGQSFNDIILNGEISLSPSCFSRGFGPAAFTYNSFVPENTRIYIGPDVSNIFSAAYMSVELILAAEPVILDNSRYPSFSSVISDVESINVAKENPYYELVNTYGFGHKVIGTVLLPKGNHLLETDGAVYPVGDIMSGCVDVED
jgi:hypothetical protein